MKKVLCSLVLILASYCCFAQFMYKTTGNVQDLSGNPLPGAVIIEVGYPFNGVTADIDGNYKIYVHAEHCQLRCSHVGYITSTIVRNGQVNNFTLFEDISKEDNSVGQHILEATKETPCKED